MKNKQTNIKAVPWSFLEAARMQLLKNFFGVKD